MIKKAELLKLFSSDNRFVYNNDYWYYKGKLASLTAPKVIQALYLRWEKQGDRCLNNPYYKNVKRIWSADVFVNWGLNEILKREEWELPVVSRIGDLGNYTTDNCQIIEQRENSKQVKITDKKRAAAKLVGSVTGAKNGQACNKAIILKNILTGKVLNYKSQSSASLALGRTRAYVSVCIKDNRYIVSKISGNKYEVVTK